MIEVHADSDLADYAPIEIDGNAYVPTKMKIVSKTSFDGVCAVIDSLRLGALSKGLHTRRLKLEAKLVKGKSNSWFGAKLSLVKPGGKLSDEVKGEIGSSISKPSGLNNNKVNRFRGRTNPPSETLLRKEHNDRNRLDPWLRMYRFRDTLLQQNIFGRRNVLPRIR